MHININSHMDITDITQEQRDLIKDALTFDNPAYANAKKFSKYKRVYVNPYLTYYTEKSVSNGDGTRSKVLSVPLGTDLIKILGLNYIPLKDVSDHRAIRHCNYPKFQLELRKDQQKAEQAYMWNVKRATHPKCVIQLPTGKGKSILALYIARILQEKMLVLVHKDDLVAGWKKDIDLCFGGEVNPGLIKAKSRKIGEQITIATVQTLSRMDEEEFSKYVNEFGIVVQDECHHVGLNIFNIIDKFNSRYKLGLSATPFRSDGLDFVFDLFFGGICYKHELTEDDEDICNVEVQLIESGFQYTPFVYDKMVLNYHDFTPKELPEDIKFLSDIPYKERPRVTFSDVDNQAVLSPKTKIKVCKKILEHARQGHSCLALFTQKEHINTYYRYLCRYFPKDQIMCYYGDSKEKDGDMIERAEKKEVLITLATYAKATEGTNVKSWEVAFLVSSMNNEKNVEQATGRIRRKKDGKLNPVLVYDVRYSEAYSLKNHFQNRLKVYKRLKYKVVGDVKIHKDNKPVFSRGYKR